MTEAVLLEPSSQPNRKSAFKTLWWILAVFILFCNISSESDPFGQYSLETSVIKHFDRFKKEKYRRSSFPMAIKSVSCETSQTDESNRQNIVGSSNIVLFLLLQTCSEYHYEIICFWCQHCVDFQGILIQQFRLYKYHHPDYCEPPDDK